MFFFRRIVVIYDREETVLSNIRYYKSDASIICIFHEAPNLIYFLFIYNVEWIVQWVERSPYN